MLLQLHFDIFEQLTGVAVYSCGFFTVLFCHYFSAPFTDELIYGSSMFFVRDVVATLLIS